jgi:hypothetical protein
MAVESNFRSARQGPQADTDAMRRFIQERLIAGTCILQLPAGSQDPFPGLNVGTP